MDGLPKPFSVTMASAISALPKGFSARRSVRNEPVQLANAEQLDAP
jgi:hypothetical protein